MITSLVEMPNFFHMATSMIQFELRAKIFAGDTIDRSYDIINFSSKYF